ncbi:HAMP domain-containing protein [Evansella caseinilytica]|uniref:histidine kinase n=1 Tax=Evansella caseinilytica TaxID=1503961 RepID=A0A1H3TUP9_9BACI|nr:HAMP domain-containing sensor histidine kinase [Evansella caseinilytica]SDZ53936.1 HAMP domain-containing protein [Evansella caseinilytica]
MKYKYTAGLQRQLLKLLFYSALLAAGLTFLLIIFVLMLEITGMLFGPFRNFLQFMYYNLGPWLTIILTAAAFFVLFVIFLVRKKAEYLAQIIEAVEEASKGNWEVKLPVTAQDELGRLAASVNSMADRLQLSVEEERMAVHAKTELITNVSHDLRTPLTSVIGYLRLIDDDRYKDEVELRYYVNIAYEKSKRLERMVNDLFEYTRVSSGGLKLAVTPINLVELIGQLAAHFSLQLAEAGMEIILSFEKDKVMIPADGDKLMRVFENLISNAVKYGKDGKKVVIKLAEKENSVLVQVINYGSRIPSTELPHVFERFYRVEKSRSLDTGGSGLGLAIAKNIIDLHQGTISVVSDDYETVFKVELPKAGNPLNAIDSESESLTVAENPD